MKNKVKNILLILIVSLSVSCISIFINNNYIVKHDKNNNNNMNIGDTNILYDSSNVSYDNETSGISSSNVQDAIDELYGDAVDYSSIDTRLSAVENNFLNKTYPVGSIYISVDNTDPGTLFGGTWVAFGTGKTLVGIDTNDTDFDTVEESSGAKSVTIETANLPSHTHTVTAKGSVGAHTHTVTAKGTVSSTFSGQSTNTSNTGAHQHGGYNKAFAPGSAWGITDYNTNTSAAGGYVTSSAGAHTHTVTAKGTVSSSFTGQSTNTGSTTPTFTGSSTNTSAVGSATPTAISTMNPYITVYMWKRTA